MTSSVTGQGTAPDARDLRAALAEHGFVAEVSTTAATVVLDTFDGRLHDAGLRLARRGDVLALEGPHAVPAQVSAPTVPRFAADMPPGPFRDRVGGIIEVRALLPLLAVSSRTARLVRRNRDDKIVASVRIHDRVKAGRARLDGWFVEVDELPGYAKHREELLGLVRSAGVRPLDDGHDVVDLAFASAGVDPAGHRGDPSVPLRPDLPALDGFRLVLDNLRDAIEANRQGTIDDVDPEFLHDFRVAVRRTRSVLGHGKRVLPPDVLEWSRRDFQSLGHLTGPARDLDVYVIEWDSYVEALAPDTIGALRPVRDQLEVDRTAAHRHLATELRSKATDKLLARWRTWLDGPVDAAVGGADAARPLGTVVRRRIEKAQRRLIEQGRAITPSTPADDVHELRKDAKKLRYLLECFGGLLPAGERKAFVKRLKALQDNLGEHQDAAVHVAQLRQAVDELPDDAPPETFVAIGQLIEQLDRRRQRARDEFAERFADYDSTPTRRALEAVLDGATG